MTVRLLRPYAGQAVMTLYTGPNEDALKATGNADDRVEDATDYASFNRIRQGARLNAGGLYPALGANGALSVPDILRRVPATLDVRRVLSNYALGTLPQEALKPARVRSFYVDLDNVTGTASDSNSGLTKASALLTLSAARAKMTTDGDAVVAFGVKQDRIVREPANWTSGVNISFSFINESPARIILARTGSANAPTWTSVSGQPGVYSTPIATVADAANIIDTANKVDMAARIRVPVGGTTADQERWRDAVRRAPAAYHAPIRVASIGAVAALPGSWFYDSAAQLLYVQAIDSRNLVGDTKMQPLSTGVYARATNGPSKTVFFSGFDIAGGGPPLFIAPGVDANYPLFIGENCSWQCSASAGGSTSNVAINGSYRAIFYRCAAWHGWGDNFSYTSIAGNPAGAGIDDPSPSVFEIECVAGGAGMTGSTGLSDNAFTAHISSDVASINCVAVDSSDRPVAFVNKVRSIWVGGYIGAPIDTGGASLANHGTADQVVAYIIGTQFAPPQPGTPNISAEGNAQVTLIGVHPDVTRTQLGNAVINSTAA